MFERPTPQDSLSPAEMIKIPATALTERNTLFIDSSTHPAFHLILDWNGLLHDSIPMFKTLSRLTS